MPYRLNPKDHTEVQKKKNNRWGKVKKHTTVNAAKKHLTALNINVSAKERR